MDGMVWGGREGRLSGGVWVGAGGRVAGLRFFFSILTFFLEERFSRFFFAERGGVKRGSELSVKGWR